MLTRRPELRGRFTFVQIGVPSRSELEHYGAIESEIDRKVEEVNARHAVPGGVRPIYHHKKALGLSELVALYRMAQFCVVSSLADGMNLVAKEFVAARDDEDGVLIRSTFAGAARELTEALLVNPYDVVETANAMVAALELPAEERHKRMRLMRRTVSESNIYRWAGRMLMDVSRMRQRQTLQAWSKK